MAGKMTLLERYQVSKQIEESVYVDTVTTTEYTITIHYKNNTDQVPLSHYKDMVPEHMEVSHIHFEEKEIDFSLEE